MGRLYARTSQVAFSLLALCATLLALASPASAAPRRAVGAAPALLFTQAPCAPVHIAPVSSSPLIAQLLGGTDVTALGAASGGWRHVRIWSHTEGYIATSLLSATLPAEALEGDCSFPGVPDPAPSLLPADNGPFALTAHGHTIAPTTMYAWPGEGAAPLAGAPAGMAVTISQWAGASGGQPWYHVASQVGVGWVWSG
ncbi:MAG: SH3 domain-containing protein, partial [Chloroflexota bacterium]|nr:SH3 domain-containing protein [Chloroflexota bacterium]